MLNKTDNYFMLKAIDSQCQFSCLLKPSLKLPLVDEVKSFFFWLPQWNSRLAQAPHRTDLKKRCKGAVRQTPKGKFLDIEFPHFFGDAQVGMQMIEILLSEQPKKGIELQDTPCPHEINEELLNSAIAVRSEHDSEECFSSFEGDLLLTHLGKLDTTFHALASTVDDITMLPTNLAGFSRTIVSYSLHGKQKFVLFGEFDQQFIDKLKEPAVGATHHGN